MSLPSLTLASPTHRATLTLHLLKEIAAQRVSTQRFRLQARVVKRVRSKYERKLPLHLKAPPLESGIDFKDLIALVT